MRSNRAHYWESIAFNTDPVWIETYVADEGIVVNGRPEQSSLKANARRISGVGDKNGDKVRGYLIHPSESSNEEVVPYFAYRHKFRSIIATVGVMIPALRMTDADEALITNPYWTEYSHSVVFSRDRLWDTPAGKVLFKYNYDHHGKMKATLWIEESATDLHHDE